MNIDAQETLRSNDNIAATNCKVAISYAVTKCQHLYYSLTTVKLVF